MNPFGWFAAFAQHQPALTITVPESMGRNPVAAFSPDGRQIITGGSALTFWDAFTGERIQSYADDAISESIVCSPDGKLVATAYLDYSSTVRMKIWNVEIGQCKHVLQYSLPKLQKGYFQSYAIGMAFSPDGKELLTGDVATRFLSWSTETGQILREYHALGSMRDPILGILFLPDGNRAIVQRGLGEIYLVDLRSDAIISTLPQQLGLSLSADGTLWLGTGSLGLELRRVETGELVISYPVEYTMWLRLTDLSPDGRLILVGGSDYQDDRLPRFILDTETGEVLREYGICLDRVLKFAPDGKRFMAVTNDDKQRVRIYDISDLQAAVKEPSVEKQE